MPIPRLHTDQVSQNLWGGAWESANVLKLPWQEAKERERLPSAPPQLVLRARKLSPEGQWLAQHHTASARVPTRTVTPTTLVCSRNDHIPQNSDHTRNHHSLQGAHLSENYGFTFTVHSLHTCKYVEKTIQTTRQRTEGPQLMADMMGAFTF